MKRLRVLVVDDSLTVRKHLALVICADPELMVVAEAANGQEAVELCGRLRPDVITMDIHLPVMNGLLATEQIMARFPTPILIVSASTDQGGRAYDALLAGAVDIFDKAPKGSALEWSTQFLVQLKRVAKIRVITHVKGFQGHPSVPVLRAKLCQVVALGASTGGPGALCRVLQDLRLDLAVPVLVVIHLNENFAPSFVSWLGQQVNMSVAFAVDGAPLSEYAGRVVLGPPGRHLLIKNGRLSLSLLPADAPYRPSIDVLFESLAQTHGDQVAAALLTGMGSDGAAGLLEIKRRGGFTVAQDEATSVVYGMPRVAMDLGAATRVLPLNEIGPTLRRVIGVKRERS